jgi:hypothetical protein
MVPVLRYVLDMDAHHAIAVSLLVVGTTSLAAVVPHAMRGRVRWRTGVLFGSAGMVGAYLAGSVARLIPAWLLLSAFSLMMFATALAMLRSRPKPESAGARSEIRVLKVLAEGLAVGAVTGLVGAGGGFLVVPALVLLGGLPMDVAIGTSLLVIAMKSFAGFAGFAGHTSIDWSLGLAITAAAIVGSVSGSVLARRVSPDALRTGFGWFVVAMAFFVLAQELPAALGYTPFAPAALGVSALGTMVVALVRRAVVRRRVSSGFSGAHEHAGSGVDDVGTSRVTLPLGGETP